MGVNNWKHTPPHGNTDMNKQMKNQNAKGNRLLISINVLGSSGPIRFIVSEDELVATVIETTLKSYAREGRLPVLGSDIGDFLLYCPLLGPDALSPWDTIGSRGARNFMLCRKPQQVKMMEADEAPETLSREKKSCRWKAWFNKSIKISSHKTKRNPCGLASFQLFGPFLLCFSASQLQR